MFQRQSLLTKGLHMKFERKFEKGSEETSKSRKWKLIWMAAKGDSQWEKEKPSDSKKITENQTGDNI